MIDKFRLLITDRKLQKQLIKYILVGGSSAVTELVIFAFLRSGMEFNIAVSNITATVVATIVNFILNRSWAFNNNSNLTRSLLLYLCLFVINTTFSTYFIGFLVNMGVRDFISKFSTMIIITIWNFFLYKKVVFK